MSMKRFVCWSFDQAAVRRIINPDADTVPDHVFRAVHTDAPIPVKRVYGQKSETLTPTEFIERFLDPSLNYQLVPVLGYAGVGKSHLLHWMGLHIPRGDAREVIVVPKAQTNLRDVVLSIVRTLPEAEQLPYLDQLQLAAGTSMNKAAQRLQVLSSLAIAITNDEVRSNSGLDPRLEEYLLEALPALLTDQHIRNAHFEVEGGLAAEIAAHVFEKPRGYNPAEDRREFHPSDLPLDGRDFVRAGAAAADLIALLMNEEAAIAAVLAILNRNLDTAIASCLNMGGQRLVDLMTKVRRHLKGQGKELVVLIEDFARLQGLDAALLQVLLERPEGVNADLCPIRTAFAVTTGYYRGLQDTVETRTTFVVDLGTPNAKGIDYVDATARYFNALRWGDDGLQQMFAGSVDLGAPVPSRCKGCEHQSVCHAAFGESGEYGLYPLDRQAVNNLASRAAALEEKSNRPLTMRAFQSMVLAEIAEAGQDLRAGAFPPPRLLSALGGQTLSAVRWEELRRRDSVHAQRRLALHELWSGAAQVHDFSPAVHEAFDLPPLGDGAAPPPRPPYPDPERASEDRERGKEAAPAPSDPVVGDLDRWGTLGPAAPLPQATAQELRTLLFSSLKARIDWDAEGLIEGGFCGQGKPFQASSILFEHAEVETSKMFMTIKVHCTVTSAIALQGLWERSKTGGSQFADAAEKLVRLANLLDELAERLLQQLRSVDTAKGQWDPLEAAFGIVVACALATDPQLRWREPAELVRGTLLTPPGPPQWLDHDATTTMAVIAKGHDKAMQAIYHRAAATKGSSMSDPMMDASRLLRLARTMAKGTWAPSKPPDIVPGYQEGFAGTARMMARDLAKRVEQESAARAAWRQRMEETLGDGTRAGILKTVRAVIDSVGGGGLGVPSGALVAARSEFEKVDYDGALKAARHAPATSTLGALAALSPAILPATLAATKLVNQFEAYLTLAERELDNQEGSLGIDPGAIASSEGRIRDALDALKEALDA